MVITADCKSAASQRWWFESIRAHNTKLVSTSAGHNATQAMGLCQKPSTVVGEQI
jgi:hypothetical protein